MGTPSAHKRDAAVYSAWFTLVRLYIAKSTPLTRCRTTRRALGAFPGECWVYLLWVTLSLLFDWVDGWFKIHPSRHCSSPQSRSNSWPSIWQRPQNKKLWVSRSEGVEVKELELFNYCTCFPNEALTNWCLRVVGGYRHRLHNLPALERHHASQKGIGLKPNTSNSTNPLWVLSIKALAHQSSIFPEGLALFRVDVDRLLQEDWVWWDVLYRNINSFLMQVRFVEGYHLHTDEQCMLVGWELVDLAMMCWTWSALSCFHLNAKVTVQSHSISL